MDPVALNVLRATIRSRIRPGDARDRREQLRERRQTDEPTRTTTACASITASASANRLFGRLFLLIAADSTAARAGPARARATRGRSSIATINATIGDTQVFSVHADRSTCASAFARAHADQVVARVRRVASLGLPANYHRHRAGAVSEFQRQRRHRHRQRRPSTISRATPTRWSGTSTSWRAAISSRRASTIRVLQFNAFQNNNAAGQFTFNRGMTQGRIANVQARSTRAIGVASLLLGAGSGGTIDHISGLALQRAITPRSTSRTTGACHRRSRSTSVCATT